MVAGQAPTAQTFQVTGIARAAEEAGVELVNFDVAGVGAVNSRGPVSSLHIAKPVLEADVVISLPKLKTHSATLFTGAVKNMYGCIPGFRKAEYHRQVPNLKEFAGLLADIFAAARPRLAVMDGIVGMEGNGPSAGNPRKAGVILASEDSVALDAVACRVIGLNPFRVYTTAVAHERGLGVGDAARIEVVGTSLEEVLIKDWDLPSNAMLEAMPGFLVSRLLGMLRARPEINRQACAGCCFCVESCPVQAMEMSGGIPAIDYQKCISCLCCQELCPQKAVEMKQVGPLAKALGGIMGHRSKRRRAKFNTDQTDK